MSDENSEKLHATEGAKDTGSIQMNGRISNREIDGGGSVHLSQYPIIEISRANYSPVPEDEHSNNSSNIDMIQIRLTTTDDADTDQIATIQAVNHYSDDAFQSATDPVALTISEPKQQQSQ